MIKYRRIFCQGGVIRYEYYPEGDTSEPGIVEFREGESPKLIKESGKDVRRFYGVHALYGIDTSKEKGTVAWY